MMPSDFIKRLFYSNKAIIPFGVPLKDAIFLLINISVHLNLAFIVFLWKKEDALLSCLSGLKSADSTFFGVVTVQMNIFKDINFFRI